VDAINFQTLKEFLALTTIEILHDLGCEYAVEERWNCVKLVVEELQKRKIEDSKITRKTLSGLTKNGDPIGLKAKEV